MSGIVGAVSGEGYLKGFIGGGSPGKDGKSAYEIALEHGFEGTEEEWLASLKGEPGAPGADGKDGVDGYTPVKGIDYYTEAEKQEMVQSVIAGIPVYDGSYTDIEDNPIPTEIATEAEMTALLETAPVGSVFKYVGETTDKYENGALYIVEAA